MFDEIINQEPLGRIIYDSIAESAIHEVSVTNNPAQEHANIVHVDEDSGIAYGRAFVSHVNGEKYFDKHNHHFTENYIEEAFLWSIDNSFRQELAKANPHLKKLADPKKFPLPIYVEHDENKKVGTIEFSFPGISGLIEFVGNEKRSGFLSCFRSYEDKYDEMINLLEGTSVELVKSNERQRTAYVFQHFENYEKESVTPFLYYIKNVCYNVANWQLNLSERYRTILLTQNELNK